MGRVGSMCSIRTRYLLAVTGVVLGLLAAVSFAALRVATTAIWAGISALWAGSVAYRLRHMPEDEDSISLLAARDDDTKSRAVLTERGILTLASAQAGYALYATVAALYVASADGEAPGPHSHWVTSVWTWMTLKWAFSAALLSWSKLRVTGMTVGYTPYEAGQASTPVSSA